MAVWCSYVQATEASILWSEQVLACTASRPWTEQAVIQMYLLLGIRQAPGKMQLSVLKALEFGHWIHEESETVHLTHQHQVKEVVPHCSCRKQCMASLTHDHCQKLFNSFWELSDFNQRNAFLFGQIQAARPARHYADAAESRRQFTFLFYVKDNCGESVRVCKQAFLSIFGLQNSRGRINNIMTQIVSGSGTPKSDNRGKHHNRPNRTESSILDDVINHIDSFPKYESPYSWKDNIGRKYPGAELSINTMYDLYVTQCKETNRPAASRDCYRRTFCSKFNLGFSSPKTDTCKTCCATEIQVKMCTDDNERKKLRMNGQSTSSKLEKLLTCSALTQQFQLIHRNRLH